MIAATSPLEYTIIAILMYSTDNDKWYTHKIYVNTKEALERAREAKAKLDEEGLGFAGYTQLVRLKVVEVIP